MQLLSLLTQANLCSTLDVWLVNMNCHSLVDLTASAEVKSVARLPRGGGCVNYKSRHAGEKKVLYTHTKMDREHHVMQEIVNSYPFDFSKLSYY